MAKAVCFASGCAMMNHRLRIHGPVFKSATLPISTPESKKTFVLKSVISQAQPIDILELQLGRKRSAMRQQRSEHSTQRAPLSMTSRFHSKPFPNLKTGRDGSFP